MDNKKYANIYIKKRTVPEWLTCYIVMFPLFISFLVDFINLPSFIKYSADVVWILMLVIMLFLKRNVIFQKKLAPFITYIIYFFGMVSITYLFRYQSFAYFFWGIRNNFRFYVTFLACSMFMDSDDAEDILKFFDYIFWANAVISFFQFFVLGYNQDYLGGVFGVDRGCNANSLAFFSIVISKSILSFINGKEKAWLCFLKCGVSLIIAAMAELKFYFIIFIIILVASAMVTRFSARKLILILSASFLFMLASTLMTAVFGEGSSLSLDRIFELITAKSYATSKDLGRFTAIQTISQGFFNEINEKLFGFGIGNCDTSTFAVCNSPFYQTYYYLHYTWFSSAFLFLETGYIGLITFLAFFVLCFFCAKKQLKFDNTNSMYCQISMIISIICVILTFYNSSLRMEVSYLIYFALSLPFLRVSSIDSVQLGGGL